MQNDAFNVPTHLYPVIIVEDRYCGTCSGGRWLALRNADMLVDRLVRAHCVLEYGPGGDDEDALDFWGDPPDWIATGATTDEAIRKLIASGANRS